MRTPERSTTPTDDILSSPPSLLHSSASEVSFEQPEPESGKKTSKTKPGETSPSAVCRQRKMSSVVVTSPQPDHVKAEYLEGRPKIVCRQVPKLPCIPAIRRGSTVPLEVDLPPFMLNPSALRDEAWSEANAAHFKVRGPSYLEDSVKVTSQASVFRLLTVDLVKVEKPILTGLCAHPNERIQKALRREKETGTRELPDFVFAINLAIPGQSYYHWVAYFGIDDMDVITTEDTAFGRLAKKFFFGESDLFRRSTFKMIPKIVEGNFVVRKAVGSKPAILGRKLKQYYIRDERFFELIVDIGSEGMAQKIVKLALGYARTLTVDMMFLLEGRDPTTLPERILGGARIKGVDFKKKDGQRVCQEPN